jgi:hypothetical protein
VPQPTIELIRGVPLFAEADDHFLQQLAGEFMERTYAVGETIAEEGEAGRTFVVIERGEVTVTVRGQEVGRLGPGEARKTFPFIRPNRSNQLRAKGERGERGEPFSFFARREFSLSCMRTHGRERARITYREPGKRLKRSPRSPEVCNRNKGWQLS